METSVTERPCTKCGVTKSLDQFHKQGLGRYGVRANCKVCQKKAAAPHNRRRAAQLRAFPALLAAIETFLRMDARLASGGEIGGGQWHAAIVMARAAVAEATGGAP